MLALPQFFEFKTELTDSLMYSYPAVDVNSTMLDCSAFSFLPSSLLEGVLLKADVARLISIGLSRSTNSM